LWTPLVLNAADHTAVARKNRYLHLFARLKPDATLHQARAELASLALRAQQDFPDTEKGWGASVRTLPDFLLHDFGIGSAIVILMTTVGFVLMIACANVAGLLLARAAGRRKELAIRISLGATRMRIVRQLLTEGLVIAMLGGGAGVLLAYWGIHYTRTNLVFNDAISAVPLSLDANVLFFTLGISLISALLCGLAPALQASRTDINTSLKDESRAASAGRSQGRLRTVLVMGEIALALFLLIGTGHLIRGIYLIDHQNLGFEAEHLLTAGLTLDSGRYKDALRQALFVRDLLPRTARLPGAEDVAIASTLPALGPDSVTLRIKDHPELPANQSLSALDVVVSADYFRAAGVPLLAGRTFTEMDNAAAPRVILVNREFVRRYLKNEEPLGQQVLLNVDAPSAATEWSEIIGVAGNVKTFAENFHDIPEVYEPFQQRPVSSFSLMVRSGSDPGTLAPALRNAVTQVDSELPLARVMSMSSLIERQRGGNTFFVRLLSTFAILALLLASIGIYGLIAYSVGQRTLEIGIRMALGAKNSDVQRMILWEGVKMSAVGAAVGLALALPLPKLFDALFAGLHFREPQLYLIVPAAIFAVALLAAYIPARRASSMNPMSALRSD
ncbi:MAG: ABC transporter permease, partial [Candidatus Acidiferrales bacterium]